MSKISSDKTWSSKFYKRYPIKIVVGTEGRNYKAEKTENQKSEINQLFGKYF